MRVANPRGLFIDCRLNILGVPVWEDSCRLITGSGAEWTAVGQYWDLPVHVPQSVEELQAAAAKPLRLTACQYCDESPGADLAAMLNKTRDFSAGLQASVEAADGSGARRLQ